MLLNQRSSETDTLYAVPLLKKAGWLRGTAHVFAPSGDVAEYIVRRPEYADAIDACVRESVSGPGATNKVVVALASEVTDPGDVAEVMSIAGRDIRAMALEERLECEVDSLRAMLLQDDDRFARDVVRQYLESLTTAELLSGTQVEDDLESSIESWLEDQNSKDAS